MITFTRWVESSWGTNPDAVDAGEPVPAQDHRIEVEGNTWFRSFANWYNHDRGSWKEVEAAAQSSRGLGRFLDEVKRQFAGQDAKNVAFDYQGVRVKNPGQVADIIQRNTAKVFRLHPYRPDGTTADGMAGTDPQSPSQPGSAMTPDQRRRVVARYQSPGESSFPSTQLPGSGGGVGHGVMPFLQAMERRLREVERKLGIERTGEYSRSVV